MNVTFDKIDEARATITVSLVEDDYKNDVKKELNALAMRRPLKGFRPGHQPMSLMQKMYGAEVKSYVVDRLVSEAIQKYLQDNQIRVLGEPLLAEGTKVDLKVENEPTFKFDLGLRPEISINPKEVAVPYYTINVTDDMVEKRLETYRNNYGKIVPGDKSDEDAMLHGELVELDENGNAKEEGIIVDKTVISPRHIKDDELKNQLIGLTVGDQLVINPAKATNDSVTEMAAMLNVDKERAEGIKSDFRFTVNEIMVNQPAELDQELFDAVLGPGEVTTEEDFRTRVHEMIARQFVGDSNYRFTIDVQDALTKAAGEIALPDEFLKRLLVQRNEKTEPEKIEEQYPQARQGLIWTLIKDELAGQLDVKVENEDVQRIARFTVIQQFAQYGMGNLPDEVIEKYAKQLLEDPKNHDEMVDRAFDDKLYAALKENVKLEEKTVSADEFNALFAAPEKPEQ